MCGRVVTNADYPLLEKIAESAIKDRQKFERLVVSKEKLLEMFYVSRNTILWVVRHSNDNAFQYNEYKKYLIETKVPDGTSTTVYRCGPMVDLCVGPHIPHTGRIKAFMVTKVSDRGDSHYSRTRSKYICSRTPLHISSEIQTTTLYNVYMASPSPTRSK